MQLFMGHIVSSLHILNERIFFSSVSSNYVCLQFSPPPKFFPKTCFVMFFLLLQGEKDVFKTYVDHRGSCFLDSQFPLILCCVCFCLLFDWVIFINSDKKGEKQMKFWKCFLKCFVQGEIKLFLKGREYTNFLMYLTQGKSQFTFVFILCSTHAFICLLSVSRIYRLIQLCYCLHL